MSSEEPTAPSPLPEANTPEANTPEANTPEANTPEANTPEANTPEANTPEANTPEANTPEANTPEANTPEANTPEANTPEANTPEANTPEANTPEANTPETALDPASEGKASSGDESSTTLNANRVARALHSSMVPTIALVGLFTLALFYTLYAAASFFLPVVIALLLDFLFSPVVRAMKRAHIPAPLGAALVLLGLIGGLALGLYQLSGPASSWVEKAPQTLRTVEYKLRGVAEAAQQVQEATKQVENIAGGEGGEQQQVQVQRPTLSDALMSQTQQFAAGLAVLLFLLYFLLASGDLFLRKLVRVLPLLRRKRIAVQIARRIEDDLSAYLFTYAFINTVLGTAVGFALWLVGMPNPVLWGFMVAVLNFVPYLGPLVGVTIVGLVAFVSFDTAAQAAVPPALYFGINALEGNLITPLILGQRLQLNPVAIFISLTFWGWIWGVAGALLAVPLLVAIKSICDNVLTLRPLGEFLGR